MVSIDYVADAIHELCEGPFVAHETFHLTAGAKASTLGELAMLASTYFRLPLPQVVPPSEFAAVQGSLSDLALESSRAYFPYFAIGSVFDNTQDERQAPARRNSGIAAGRVPRAATRLRDCEPLG